MQINLLNLNYIASFMVILGFIPQNVTGDKDLLLTHVSSAFHWSGIRIFLGIICVKKTIGQQPLQNKIQCSSLMFNTKTTYWS